MVRKISPRPGLSGRIHYIQNSQAADWPEGTEIVVLSIEGREARVRDAAGREIVCCHFDIDVGHEYRFGDGHWLHESEPRVLRYLAKLLRESEATPSRHQPMESHQAKTHERIRAVLTRYGHSPSPASTL